MPREVTSGTAAAMTYEGTLRKVTLVTTPPAQRTLATTRPDGTSIVTSVSPSASDATRPVCTAHTPSAIVPWPHAVVPEEHPEVGAIVVGRNHEASVHVRVPAWFPAEQLTHTLQLVAARRDDASLGHGGSLRHLEPIRYDAERLACGVEVHRADWVHNMAHIIMLASTLLIGDRESEELVAASAIREVEHHASLRDRIGKSLSAAIMSGELEPGALVTVPTLALQFAVSATPVREALLDLKQRGFVSSVRNKGFRVTAVSAEDLGEIVELRQWLEVPAMRDLATDFPMSAMPTCP